MNNSLSFVVDNSGDWRLLENGSVIPVSAGGYADQPFFIRADDGALVLICTTGKGHEGTPGQHVASVRSTDDGKTWGAPVALESANDVESSYAVLLKTASGRIYAFYNHNTDNVRKIPADKAAYPDGWCRRVDTLGYFVFKFSDDHGKTWSEKRYPIAVREFEIDRQNGVNGSIRYFWNVGKPFVHKDCGYVPLHKVGGIGINVFNRTEGALLCSDNILTEPDPAKIRFETLPDGDIGLRAPEGGGSIAEEQSIVTLSDGTFFCVYRTVAGHPACSYSRDKGHTWTAPAYLSYPDGHLVKNPRAANLIWKLSGGRYFYWFHNHSEKSYAHRSIVWCLGAQEADSPDGKVLRFSQPEVLLYNDSITRGMSYPDLMEMPSGDLLISETEKKTARMHTIPAAFVRRLFGQTETPAPLFSRATLQNQPGTFTLPKLPVFFDHEPWENWESTPYKDMRTGFSLELVISKDAKPGPLADNRSQTGRGFLVTLTTERKIELSLNDPYSGSHWTSSQTVSCTQDTHVVIVIDGGPKIISMIFDGVFDDGGPEHCFGFGRFNPYLHSPNGGDLQTSVGLVACALYDVALMTAQAIGLFEKQND
jgi:hypothetical protein